MKKVSIIIPVFNTAEFLTECLQSVVDQTYKALEIIVINDGSTDGSKEIIHTFSERDERIKSIHLQENKGVGFARNIGIAQATGEYVYFLDSDDYLSEQAIQLLIENIGDHVMISGKIKRIKTKDDSKEMDTEIILKEGRKLGKHFSNSSILHRLISMDFIKANQLKFSEDVSCYSELPFIVAAMKQMETYLYLKGCFYYKRLRNDPISNPALMQSDRDKIVSDFIKIFNSLRVEYNGSVNAETFLDRLFLNFYRKTIVMLFAERGTINKFFNEVSMAASKIDEQNWKNLNIVVRKEMNLLIKGKKGQFANVLRFHHLARNVKRAIGSRRKIYVQLYRSIFMKMSLQERTIVLESFLGKNYSDSPKYIYEYMINNNMDYKFVWVFNQTGKKIPGNAKQVKRFSLAYYYYLGRAKYWVSNSRMPLHLNKRPDNVYLQTWHGTPLKKLVFDMNDIYSANPNYKKHFYQQSRRWDYLISPNQYSSDIFRRAFKFDKTMLEYGYPRNDILYQKNNKEYIQLLKARLNIPLDKKVVLYAPTWRDDEFYEPGKYKFNLKLDLQKMREQLGDEYVVALRMHYFIADEIDTTGLDGFAYNFSKYDDIAELYLLSDILITDYSSVFFDYANLKRPILFFTYDLEKYRDTLRGFYINIENEVPGPLLKTSDEVIDAIANIEGIKNNYKNVYGQFYEKFCNWDDGEASKKVVEKVFLNK
ncbi:bifunctional glycosyltransferase/CDP-glycerol:glycerophosphate glycerophosphotransferase [Heyndrickxia vini]|uniref:CDP-glycerol:glycerophosphate glycerophosphotransferase n=1 Tax=Heyndrickxia vini TaxID=1476025 RepID=A0ABX7E560_9BACI|nr:CDP-glycerol:glycerophosphate glycerophosphotransferase [Heyndrickxia vini]QQZ10349.1 CDP-glycerol:glycerophosphate glycerophosphotransferase [Heyndrickxia vini]